MTNKIKKAEYSVIDIANEFIKLANKEKSEKCQKLSNLKLQKLCYIAHGFSLGIKDTALFKEKVKAWPYGPVIVELYNNEYIKSCDSPCNMSEVENAKNIDENTHELIKAVWNNYKHYSASKLVDITHKAGSPWSETFMINRLGIIKNEDISEYYKYLTQ